MRELVFGLHSQVVICSPSKHKLVLECLEEVIVRRCFVLEKCDEDLGRNKPETPEQSNEGDTVNYHANQSKKHTTYRVDN